MIYFYCNFDDDALFVFLELCCFYRLAYTKTGEVSAEASWVQQRCYFLESPRKMI